MINSLRNRIKKLNNRGSSLVVVIIVIAFVSILGTLLLYLSVMNYQMKSNDYKTRVSFYGGEEPLEELRVQMAADMSEVCEKAYMEVMSEYSSLVSSDMRSTKYKEYVLDGLQTIWAGRTADASGTNWVQGISRALQNNSDYHVISGTVDTIHCGTVGCTKPYHIVLLNLAAGEDRLECDDVEGRAILQKIKVVYEENEFYSIITTDFCMLIPEFNWNMQQNINVENNATPTRQTIDYEKSVVYLNYTKQ